MMKRISRRGIAVASQELAAARRRSRQSRNAERALWRRIHTIDHLLGVLEDRNLDGTQNIDAAIREELDRLPRAVGLPLPCDVKLARNTRRLHAALLDWEEEVLNTLVPAREQYAAVDAVLDAEEPPRYLYRRATRRHELIP